VNENFPSFDNLNKKLSSGFHLVDMFSNHFSFLSVNQKDPVSLNIHQDRLDNIYKESLAKQDIVLIITDTSIKNNVTILISHIYRGQEIIAKSVHYAINVNFTKAKLFAIKCGINHTIYLQNFNHIIVITDAISATKWIFNMTVHPYQLHFIAILKNLKEFFNKSPNNFIDFWNCPDNVNVKTGSCRLNFFLFSFSFFIFLSFYFLFYFLFLELGLGVK